jgi:hypothetical protein
MTFRSSFEAEKEKAHKGEARSELRACCPAQINNSVETIRTNKSHENNRNY